MSWINDVSTLLVAATGAISAITGFLFGRRGRKIKQAREVNDIIVENDNMKKTLIERIDELSKQYIELHENYLSLKNSMAEKDMQIYELKQENEELRRELEHLEDKIKNMNNGK